MWHNFIDLLNQNKKYFLLGIGFFVAILWATHRFVFLSSGTFHLLCEIYYLIFLLFLLSSLVKSTLSVLKVFCFLPLLLWVAATLFLFVKTEIDLIWGG